MRDLEQKVLGDRGKIAGEQTLGSERLESEVKDEGGEEHSSQYLHIIENSITRTSNGLEDSHL